MLFPIALTYLTLFIHGSRGMVRRLGGKAVRTQDSGLRITLRTKPEPQPEPQPHLTHHVYYSNNLL